MDVSRGFLHRVLAGDEWVWPAARISADAAGEGEGPLADGRTWTVRVRLSVDANSEQQARAAVEDVLAQLGVAVRGTPAVAAPATAGRFWRGEAELDLSGLPAIQPNDAATRFKYVVRNVSGVTLASSGQPDEYRALWEWLPERWEMLAYTRSEVFVNPSTRAANIYVTAEP